MSEVVIVTEKMLADAKLIGNEFRKYQGKSILNGDGNFYGFLGELVFEAYLKGLGIPYSCKDGHFLRQKGGWDTYDFIVYGSSVDVKTVRDKPDYKNLLVEKKKFDNGVKYDYYVAVRLVGEPEPTQAVISGFARREDVMKAEFKEFGHGVVDYFLPLDELHPISELTGFDKVKPK
jgi:hypothetical protein